MVEFLKGRALHLLAALFCTFELFAEGEAITCEHVFMTDTVVVPSCTQEGSVKHSCTLCSDTTFYEVLAMVDHVVETQCEEATCQKEGICADRCTVCGAELGSVNSPKLAHQFEAKEIKVATCSQAGEMAYSCVLCHDTTYTIATEMLSHTVAKDTISATCQKPGVAKEFCSICGEVIQSVVLPKLDHQFISKITKEASCSQAGRVEYTCSLCEDTTYVVAMEMLPHTIQTDSVPATCQVAGVVRSYCSVCEKDLSSVVLPKLAHQFVSDTIVKATCVKTGSIKSTCSLCHDTSYVTTLPTVDHQIQRDSVAATCHQKGSCKESCSVCKLVIKDLVYPMLTHQFVTTKVAATCVKDGAVIDVCKLCNDSSVTVVPAKGHNIVKDSVAATCHAAGHYYVGCTACDYSEIHKDYPQLKHDLQLKSVTDPTCDKKGTEHYVCKLCGDDSYVSIPAKGHTIVKKTVAATCTEKGLYTETCSVCGYVQKKEEIAALGHNYKVDLRVEPTCTKDGYEHSVCSLCGKEKYVGILAGHTLKSVKVANSCTAYGYEISKCSKCDFSDTTKVIKPHGHDYQVTASKSATCTEDGSKTYTCSYCKDSYKETIKALGHDYKVTVVDPTIWEEGYTQHKCRRCSDTFKDNVVAKLDIKEYFSSLKFSEVMPCNISTYINKDNYNFSGFVEISNSSTKDISIKKCVLTHYKKTSKSNYTLKWQWEITNSVTIPASSYGIVWMDESSANNHAPYKLDADGGYLTLYADGVRIDSIAYEATDAHISYGRYGENVGFMEPTPYKKNKETVANLVTNRCAKPTFSVAPGILTASTEVSLGCATSGAAIYYTLDGTQPSATNGMLYTEPIEVSANANIRAIACLSGKLPSKIATGSYIFMDSKHSKCAGFTVPIVSLTIDNLYYNDATYGMFEKGSNGIVGEKDCQQEVANYNRDWKRPLNFEYIVDGKQVVSQEVEAAVEGGCSRKEKIKSLSLKTSKKTGAAQYNYHFFASKPDVYHNNLHLRNGGNAYSTVPFWDGMVQEVCHGMNIDYQAYQPVAYYLNGKYIGMMALNERVNADYVKANYGIDDEDIDFVVVGDQTGIHASKGTMDAYKELVSYLNDNKATNPDYYAGACARMDMDEYIDYQIFEQFIANTDWPGNNTKIWREKENGLFRWLLFDTDFGFNLYGANLKLNMIEVCQGVSNTNWASNKSWMVDIFKPLSKNKEFQKKFTTRFLIELSDRFQKANIRRATDSIVDLVKDEFCAFRGNMPSWEMSNMKEFAENRAKYVYRHLSSYVAGDSATTFTVESNVAGAVVTLNGEKLPSPYKGKYITNYGFELAAYPPVGYVFDKWEISDSSRVKITGSTTPKSGYLPGTLSGTVRKGVSLKAIFKKGSSALPTLVINEVCASSNSKSDNADDYGNYPDWIELHNYGTKDIDLAGFRLTNAKSGKVSELPYDAENMVIKAGEHKLLWAKGDNRRGANYLDFKLDNDKASQICLSYFDAVGEVDVDCIRYKTHATNESYGRVEDNSDDWTIFGICEDSESYAATPGNVNGSTCEKYSTETTETWVKESGLTLYPNPASDYLNVATEEEILSYTIYDMSGAPLRQDVGNATTISVEGLYAGLYMIEVRTVSDVYRMKFLKE